jgi:hypothetical protein
MSTDHEKAQVDPKLIAEAVVLLQGRVISKLSKGFWKDRELLETILKDSSFLDQMVACMLSEHERKEFGRKNDVSHRELILIPPSPKLIAETIAAIQRRVVFKLPNVIWESPELLQIVLRSPVRLDQIIAAAFSEYERHNLYLLMMSKTD